ncbi:MAG: LysR substrate-binding domain-containing protein [Pseudomonadota bacterium]
MSRHIPLSLLEPFEASARLGSFTRAAEELSVTQSAVSQRVRKLETLIGVALFERGHRTVTLTREGRDLLNGVSIALRHLSAATKGVQSGDARPVLRLTVDTSIAQLWLLPRLRTYMAAPEAARLDLTVSDEPGASIDADIALLHGDGHWPGYDARSLFPDEIFPVCAADYLTRHPIEAPKDLLTAELIDLDYLHWNWLNWGIWFTEAGLDPAQARPVLRTNSYVTQLDAARAGLGVALGWRRLVDDDLARGTLVQPVADAIVTGYGYFLLVRQDANEDARALAHHLMQSSDSPVNVETARASI